MDSRVTLCLLRSSPLRSLSLLRAYQETSLRSFSRARAYQETWLRSPSHTLTHLTIHHYDLPLSTAISLYSLRSSSRTLTHLPRYSPWRSYSLTQALLKHSSRCSFSCTTTSTDYPQRSLSLLRARSPPLPLLLSLLSRRQISRLSTVLVSPELAHLEALRGALSLPSRHTRSLSTALLCSAILARRSVPGDLPRHSLLSDPSRR